MAQDMFTAGCGCSWDGGRHRQACDGWRALVANRDRLQQGTGIDYEALRTIEEQMAEHTPPWMMDERP
jgi:hypothetical protein